MEHWLTTKYDPDFEVSNEGRVRNKHTGKILHFSLNEEGGYHRVSMNGKRYYVHRVVADTFFDGDHDGLDVNHIDGNKLNNRLPNLEWCTRKQNIQHAFENGLHYKSTVVVTRCKFCKYRYEFDICEGKDDDFYCSYGEH